MSASLSDRSPFIDLRPDLPSIPKPAQQRAGVKPGERVPTEALVAAVEDGVELHDSLRDLAARGWTEAQLVELMDQSAAKDARPEDWEKRRREIPRLVKSAGKKREAKVAQAFGGEARQMPPNNPMQAAAPDAVELPLMLPGDFKKRPVVEREWIVPDLMPRGEPTLLFGAGATGKSLLLLQLCISMAAGHQWLECDVPPGRAMMFTCEDSTDEINRRARAVLDAMDLDWDDLGDRLAIVPMRDSEADAVLATEQGGVLKTTPSYDALKHLVTKFDADFVVIDTLADAFAGDENQRAQAKQFVGRIARLSRKATYVVTAHPSVSGMESGRGSSGSTGWPAAVRSHLYFGRVYDGRSRDEGQHEPDPDVRTLSNLKGNYAQQGAGGIEVRWDAGTFKAVGRVDRIRKGDEAERVFLELLRIWEKAGNYVNATGGATYAPTVFAGTQQAKAARLNKRELRDAMRRLIGAGRIESAMRKSNRNDVSYLRIVEDASG
jgi:RecA-family ATPase